MNLCPSFLLIKLSELVYFKKRWSQLYFEYRQPIYITLEIKTICNLIIRYLRIFFPNFAIPGFPHWRRRILKNRYTGGSQESSADTNAFHKPAGCYELHTWALEQNQARTEWWPWTHMGVWTLKKTEEVEGVFSIGKWPHTKFVCFAPEGSQNFEATGT